MRYSAAKTVLSAAAVLLAGAMVFAQPVLKARADFQLFQKDTLTSRTYPVRGAFTSIEIDETVSDVKIAYDAKGDARVVCREFTNHPHTVTVENGVLTISLESSSFYTSDDTDPELTLYLPGTEYENLSFSSSTGDLETSSRLTFGAVQAETTTGDVEIAGKVTGALDISTTTGDIELKGLQAGAVQAEATIGGIDLEQVTVAGSAALTTTTGDIDLEDVTAASLTAETSTGDIELEWVTINGNASLTTSSGNIELRQYTVTGSSQVESAHGRVRTDWDF